MAQRKRIGRRAFLKRSAGGLAAAAALPTIIPATALGKAGKLPPSDRVVVGFIGTGNLGRRHHLRNFCLNNEKVSPRVDVAAVCDVDANRRSQAAQDCKEATGRRVGVYEDFRRLLERKDLDAVFVVTPDHWHALVAIAAMEAGLDVYCEKPLTLTIAEGQAMVAAARRYGTVFQTGSQQRSSDQFLQACELVRNKKIGRLIKVDTHIGGIGPGTWEPAQTPPDELNWNFWLGPAPYRDYREGHVHYQFRWFQDFSGGKMTDWGAHHNDIAQWGIGADGSGPVSVEPVKFKFHESGPYDVAGEFEVHYRYANGVELTCHSNGKNGIKFTGEDGWIFVNRGEIKASDPAILEIKLGPNDVRLYKSDNHHLNWLDCIATRKRCICDVEIGHRSVTVCHMGNIAMRLGRPLKWDPEAEKFVGDEAANQLVSKPMRAPWHL